MPNTWQVQKPLTEYENHIVQDDRDAPMMYYTLNGLRSDTYYELFIQAENDIGWSDETPSFVFRTAPGR